MSQDFRGNTRRPLCIHIQNMATLWQSPGLMTLVTCTCSSPLLRKSHSYSSVTDDDLEFFRSVVGPDALRTSPDELDSFNVDWLGKYRGSSPVALVPKTTEQVSRILRHCSRRGLAVVPQGGNTSLVGASVPTASEVVLSMSRMNGVVSFDPVAGVIVCEVRLRCSPADWQATDARHLRRRHQSVGRARPDSPAIPSGEPRDGVNGARHV